MIKVYFKDDSYWLSKGLDRCESIYLNSWAFSHTEGVEDDVYYERCPPEINNGAKTTSWDCLVSVFWDLVADQSKYDDFYDMCESFYDVEESEIKLMLLAKGIEVVFLEEE